MTNGIWLTARPFGPWFSSFQLRQPREVEKENQNNVFSTEGEEGSSVCYGIVSPSALVTKQLGGFRLSLWCRRRASLGRRRGGAHRHRGRHCQLLVATSIHPLWIFIPYSFVPHRRRRSPQLRHAQCMWSIIWAPQRLSVRATKRGGHDLSIDFLQFYGGVTLPFAKQQIVSGVFLIFSTLLLAPSIEPIPKWSSIEPNPKW